MYANEHASTPALEPAQNHWFMDAAASAFPGLPQPAAMSSAPSSSSGAWHFFMDEPPSTQDTVSMSTPPGESAGPCTEFCYFDYDASAYEIGGSGAVDEEQNLCASENFCEKTVNGKNIDEYLDGILNGPLYEANMAPALECDSLAPMDPWTREDPWQGATNSLARQPQSLGSTNDQASRGSPKDPAFLGSSPWKHYGLRNQNLNACERTAPSVNLPTSAQSSGVT